MNSSSVELTLREMLKEGIDPDGTEEISLAKLNRINGRIRCCAEEGTRFFIHQLNQTFDPEAELTVLEIGSELGGSARRLALERPRTRVIVFERDEELSRLAAMITRRCQPKLPSILHKTGDISSPKSTQDQLPVHAAQAILSLSRYSSVSQTLEQIQKVLQDDGILYIEDFWVSSDEDLTPSERVLLSRELFAQIPLSNVDWCDLLSRIGFAKVTFTDTTKSWERWLHQAHDNSGFIENIGSGVIRHFEEMKRLFDSGCLKSCRIVAKKIVARK